LEVRRQTLNSSIVAAEKFGWNHTTMAAFQYRFVTTIEDLLEADAIDRRQGLVRMYRRLMEVARQFEPHQRWAIAGMLLLSLLIFAVTLTWGERLAVAAVVGVLLLYHFVIAPRRARARILASSPARRTIQLEFGNDGVLLDVENGGRVKTPWYEFTRAAESRSGVLLYFQTTKLLLPQRVFDSEEERSEFVRYLKQQEPDDTPE